MFAHTNNVVSEKSIKETHKTDLLSVCSQTLATVDMDISICRTLKGPRLIWAVERVSAQKKSVGLFYRSLYVYFFFLYISFVSLGDVLL